jgi:hypothetical protein
VTRTRPPPYSERAGATARLRSTSERRPRRGSYTSADREAPLEFDGILLVELDEDGRCRDFHESSNKRERSSR